MPRVILQNYSTFYDVTSRVQFNPVMDKRTGCFVAVADVSEAEAAAFAKRAKFAVLTDEQWLAMTSTPKPVEPTAPTTGDPLTDQAQTVALSPGLTATTAPEEAKKGKPAPDLSAPPPPPPSN